MASAQAVSGRNITVVDLENQMYGQAISEVRRFLEDMRVRFEREPRSVWSLGISDIRPYCDDDAKAEQTFFNGVGMKLAQDFASGIQSFAFCDGVANGLWDVLVELQSRDPQPSWPDLFYDAFLAFDAGEYRHEGDDEAVDPIAAYTAPYITWIVAKYS